MQTETIKFNGVSYHRYPESKRRSHRVYFQAHTKWKAPPRYLHRDVWEFYHGPIPQGAVIHHVDGNPLNNKIGNLKCLSHGEHLREHSERGDFSTERVKINLDRIRSLAAAWHRSEEGRKWHSEHARTIFKKRKLKKRKCVICEKEYESVFSRPKDRFCSRGCAQRYHYEQDKRVVPAKCEGCGQDFLTGRYRKARFCSRSCAIRYTWAKKKAGFQSEGGRTA